MCNLFQRKDRGMLCWSSFIYVQLAMPELHGTHHELHQKLHAGVKRHLLRGLQETRAQRRLWLLPQCVRTILPPHQPQTLSRKAYLERDLHLLNSTRQRLVWLLKCTRRLVNGHGEWHGVMRRLQIRHLDLKKMSICLNSAT